LSTLQSILVATAITVIFVILFIAFQVAKQNKSNSYKTLRKNKKRNKAKKLKQSFNLYVALSKIPFLGHSLAHLKKRLYVNSNLNEYELRLKTITIFFVSSILTIIGAVVSIVMFGKDLYTICVILLLAIYIRSLVTDILVSTDTKLLKEMLTFITEVKHHFNMHRMVDEAIQEATQLSSYIMSIHGNRIDKVLSGEESDLEIYYESCPNRFLKIFTGISFLTKEYGDQEIGELSLYIKNLNYIMEEIKLEILKRDELQYWLKALTTIAIIPIFFTSPMENWLVQNFSFSATYFQSSLGFISRIIIIVSSASCFLLLKQLEKHDKSSSNAVVKERYWERDLIKIRTINNIVQKIKPKSQSKQYFKIRKLINDSGSYLTMDWLYLRELASGLFIVLITLILTFTYHSINKQHILNNISYGINDKQYNQMLGLISMDESKSKETIDLDKQVVKKMEEQKNDSKEGISQIVNQISNQTDEQKALMVKRIFNKVNKIKTEHLQWYDVLASLLLGLFGMDIPIWLLTFQKFIRKSDLEEEVHQFNTIILLLMYNKSVSIEMILEWMERFADVYYNALRKCSNNLQYGTLDALENLKKDMQYPAFGRIVDNLMIAEQIEVKEAFDSLKTEREFYKDERKEDNKRIVHEKVSMGEFLGFIPTYVTTVAYLVAPMVWTTSSQFGDLMKTLGVG
jgi:hypothetical protein